MKFIGDTVNIAASLGRGEHRGRLIISPQVFRKLSLPSRRNRDGTLIPSATAKPRL